MGSKFSNPVRNIKILVAVAIVLAVVYGIWLVAVFQQVQASANESSHTNTQLEVVKPHTEALSEAKSDDIPQTTVNQTETVETPQVEQTTQSDMTTNDDGSVTQNYAPYHTYTNKDVTPGDPIKLS